MWEVKIRRITDVQPHPNADKLELAFIGGWQCVVPKDQYKIDQLIEFFPIDSLIPEELLIKWNLLGKLGGARRNRVKAVRLRGQYSIGIVQPNSNGLEENSDIAALYGIEKWEETIPQQLMGKVIARQRSYLFFDVDNVNNNIRQFEEYEVIISSKLHGTNLSCGLVDNVFKVCSRKLCVEESEDNFYWQIARRQKLEEVVRELHGIYCNSNDEDLWLQGEGLPCQDLRYSLTTPEIFLFDIRIWKDNLHHWMNYDKVVEIATKYNLRTPNVLYRGLYDYNIIKQVGTGREDVSGKQLHITEGCVIRLLNEIPTGGCSDRFILKYINPEYLIRENGTELH